MPILYFQSRGFNQGKYCSQDNLEHITPSKEACIFASITMINISSKKKCRTSKLCHMKVAKREVWSTFWICISAWNRLAARFSSCTSWTYQPPLPRFWDTPLPCSFILLLYWYQEITKSRSIFIMPTWIHWTDVQTNACLGEGRGRDGEEKI